MIARLKAAWNALAGRSIENPSTPLSDPDEWAWDALGATKTDAGVRVSRQSAMTYSAVWRAQHLISRDVGKLPLVTYRRKGEGKVKAAEHPAYELLRYKANGEMTALTVKQTLQGHALMTGNGYAYIARAGDARPVELVPLNPDTTYPVRVNGVLFYAVTVAGEQRKVIARDILHVKGLGFDGLEGYSVIQYARDSIGLGLAIRGYGSKFFKNGAKPGVVLEHPNRLSPEGAKNLLSSWNAANSGLENSHKAVLLEEGMKLNPFSMSAEDAQMIETRQFEIREVANWFGVPPHKLGDTTRTAFSSLEQENQSYLDDALDGWLCGWEAECRDKLLTEKEKREDSHVIEFTREALVRANLEARANYYNKALGGAPWMVVSDVRSRENLNELPDGMGERYFLPLNMVEAKNGQDADATKFKRDAWLGFQKDGTVSAAAANQTDIKALTRDVGLPINPTYTTPLLPVVAKVGPLVSGETLKNEAGETVGGDIIPPPEPPPTPPAAPITEPTDPPAEPATAPPTVPAEAHQAAREAAPETVENAEIPAEIVENRAEIDEKQPESTEAVAEIAPPLAAAPAFDLAPSRAAMRDLLTDAARRMAKRLGVHAKKASKHPEKWVEWLETGIIADHRAKLVEVFIAPMALAKTLGTCDSDAELLADRMIEEFRGSLLDLKGEPLEPAVDVAAFNFETSGPDVIASFLSYEDARRVPTK